MKKSDKNEITLMLDGPKITASKFVAGVNAFFRLINEVTDEVTQKKHAVEWLVSVKPGSDLVIARPEITENNARFIPEIKQTVKSGIEFVETGANERPPCFTDEAMEAIKTLASIVDANKENVEKVQIILDDTVENLSSHSIERINDILDGKHEAIGSVEGKLQILDARYGDKIQCAVYDELTNQKVICKIHPEHPDLEQKLIAAFTKRVAVYGLVKYRKDGTPINILVDEIRVFKSPDQLPPFDKLQGLFKGR